jgi:hypothetical protein
MKCRRKEFIQVFDAKSEPEVTEDYNFSSFLYISKLIKLSGKWFYLMFYGENNKCDFSNFGMFKGPFLILVKGKTFQRKNKVKTIKSYFWTSDFIFH